MAQSANNKRETLNPMVTLVEQHVIKASDPRFAQIDAAAFAAKNLYNLGNYTIRQSWLELAVLLCRSARLAGAS